MGERDRASGRAAGEILFAREDRSQSRRRRSSRAARNHELEALRYQAIVDTARDAIISIDRSGIVTDFNRAAERMFGYAAAEVTGRDVSVLMPSPYREQHAGYIQAYHRTGEKKAIGRIRQVEAVRKDGEVFPIELAVSEARVGDDVCYTAIIRDLRTLHRVLSLVQSERDRSETEVRRLERIAQERVRLADVGGITAKLVHDLGNPLSGISMQAELLKRKATREDHVPADQLVQAVDRILAGVSRLRELVRGFMDFAREQRLDLKTIDVTRFVDEVVEHWCPLASSRNVALTGFVPKSMPPLVADETKLRRVLDNLVKNAIEAISSGSGTVKVSASVRKETLEFAVADSGSGIAPHMDVFRLFETTKTDGTGIGLAVSKEIVSAHGGGIRFAANSPCGTVFTIELPTKGPVVGVTP